jgi:hypothetical protein
VSLVVKVIDDSKPGLDNKDVLIAALRREASNGGDTRCLCTGCLAYWALRHFVDDHK